MLLQRPDLAGQVRGQQVERRPTLGDDLVGDLLTTLVAGLGCFTSEVLEGLPIEVDHFPQLVGDVVVHAPEVVLLEPLPPLLAQPLHQLPQALQALAVRALEALLHEPAQRRVDVTVIEQVVGQFAHQLVGVEVEADLGAVPP